MNAIYASLMVVIVLATVSVVILGRNDKKTVFCAGVFGLCLFLLSVVMNWVVAIKAIETREKFYEKERIISLLESDDLQDQFKGYQELGKYNFWLENVKDDIDTFGMFSIYYDINISEYEIEIN